MEKQINNLGEAAGGSVNNLSASLSREVNSLFTDSSNHNIHKVLGDVDTALGLPSHVSIDNLEHDKPLDGAVMQAIDQISKGKLSGAVDVAEHYATGQAISNLNDLAAVAQYLPDGKIDPHTLIDGIQSATGHKLSGQEAAFFKGITSISKEGDRIDIQRDSDFTINKHSKGFISDESATIGKDLSFNIDNDNGTTNLSDIKGLSVGTNVTPDANVNSISLAAGKDGSQHLTANIENPMPGILQIPLDENGSTPLDVTIDKDGKVSVAGQKFLHQAINNPLINSALDTGSAAANFWNNPSVGGAFNTIGDAANTVFVAPVETAGQIAGKTLDALNPFNW